MAPSKGKASISKFSPWALSGRGVEKTIREYARCALLAREAGYDGVEIMGSEGYLINQFLTSRTNQRFIYQVLPSRSRRNEFADRFPEFD